MELVKPWVHIEPFDGVEIEKKIESACRTCYRSEGAISENSYKSLINNCLKRGHESVLEHEKITVRMLCDVGAYKDLTRHRTGIAWSVESTRYCNYSKDKFSNNIKVIDAVFIENKENYEIWKKSMESMETFYLKMASNGAKPDELRMILPHATAAEVTLTCNMREWRHIFKLRCSSHAHPTIRMLLIPLLLKFKEEMPELFADIPYDENFPKEWYADLSIEEE